MFVIQFRVAGPNGSMPFVGNQTDTASCDEHRKQHGTTFLSFRNGMMKKKITTKQNKHIEKRNIESFFVFFICVVDIIGCFDFVAMHSLFKCK